MNLASGSGSKRSVPGPTSTAADRSAPFASRRPGPPRPEGGPRPARPSTGVPAVRWLAVGPPLPEAGRAAAFAGSAFSGRATRWQRRCTSSTSTRSASTRSCPSPRLRRSGPDHLRGARRRRFHRRLAANLQPGHRPPRRTRLRRGGPRLHGDPSPRPPREITPADPRFNAPARPRRAGESFELTGGPVLRSVRSPVTALHSSTLVIAGIEQALPRLRDIAAKIRSSR